MLKRLLKELISFCDSQCSMLIKLDSIYTIEELLTGYQIGDRVHSKTDFSI